jgi:hypothetical protein
LTAGEVAIERADPDLGASRDLLQRCGHAALSEGIAGGGEDLLMIAPGVGPHGARVKRLIGGVGGAHGTFSRCLLDKPEVASV